jgi:HEAT repeat protein
MSFEDLAAQLRSSEKSEVIAAAHALGDLHDLRAVEPLIELLGNGDPALRNAAAVGLRELGDSRALAPLVRAIADPATDGQRGTLVYALGGFDAAPLVPQLIDLIIHGNFEVSRQAFSVLEGIDGVIPTPVWDAAHEEVKRAVSGADEEKRGLLEELLELFDG